MAESEPEPSRSPSGGAYHVATRLLSLAMVVLGLAILVSTIARGGGPLAVGVLFGVLFTAAGVARLYLERKSG